MVSQVIATTVQAIVTRIRILRWRMKGHRGPLYQIGSKFYPEDILQLTPVYRPPQREHNGWTQEEIEQRRIGERYGDAQRKRKAISEENDIAIRLTKWRKRQLFSTSGRRNPETDAQCKHFGA